MAPTEVIERNQKLKICVCVRVRVCCVLRVCFQVQVVNRDLSVLALRAYVEMRKKEIESARERKRLHALNAT